MEHTARATSATRTEDNPLRACCGGSCLLLFVLAIAAGVISTLVFSIMGLVQDWDVAQDECSDSNMHVFVIVALILGYGFGAKAGKSEGEAEALLCSILFSIGMVIWGFLEIFKFSCDALEGTLLYDMGILWTALHVLAIVFCAIFIVISVASA